MKKRILIVDDERGMLFSFKALLQKPGVEVDTAESTDEARALLAERDYDAAIMDIRIGGRWNSDGLKLLHYIKEHRPATETIMVTGFGNPESMESAYRLGAAFYFEKPISVVALRNALQSLGVA